MQIGLFVTCLTDTLFPDTGKAVVTPSASCASMVREYFPVLATEANDPGLARAVAEVAPRTYELSVFLADVLGVTDVGAYFPHRVTYHRAVIRCGCSGSATPRSGCCARCAAWTWPTCQTPRPAAGSAARSR